MACDMKQNELAAALGVTPAAVNNWLNRGAKDLRSDILFKLAEVSKKNALWLATEEGPEDSAETHPLDRGVPVVAFASAAVVCADKTVSPATMAEFWIPCPVLHGKRTFAFRPQDDAMMAITGSKTYPAGCFVYVDPDRRDPAHDKPVLARLASGEIILAMYMTQAGRVWLRLLNPAYPPITDPFEVAGVVIFKGEEP